MREFPRRDVKEFKKAFRGLTSPAKVQDFLDGLRFNFERKGETCRSPLMVLKNGEAHCMEGSMLAAAIFWYHGHQPLLLDLRTVPADKDHVVVLFKKGGYWGAVSKTNHAVLRYRDPVFRTVRELAMSYFNEYFLDNGMKTLRSFSRPFSLLRYGEDWLASERDLWEIPADLDASPHASALPQSARPLRLADKIEIRTGKITEWKPPR